MSIDSSISGLLNDELQTLRQDIVSAVEQSGKSATGRTVSGIQVVASGKQAQLEVPSHLFTLETGRGPARSGGDKQQFIENLKAWIVAKGISYKDEQDLQRLAGFFRWYINKFGTKQYREGRYQPGVTPVIDRAGESLHRKISDLCTNEFSKSICTVFQ